jgi:ribonucleoside-diphosphate reductase alpha chain
VVEVDKVIKRDGRLVDFDPNKIHTAIAKALTATHKDIVLAQKVTASVTRELQERFPQSNPTIEDIQDVVEKHLMRNGLIDTAKAYIVYRQSRNALRQTKEILGIRDTLKLSLNSLRILEERYLQRDADGAVVETPDEMFRRVAHAIAQADSNYDMTPEDSEERFYQAMANLEFLPNSPALMNAGTALGQLSACFVLPVDDSLTGIFDSLKYAALIHQSGGGTGFSFSRIRPKGDVVKSTMGIASGPVSFMRIFDRATETIKQGGRRRGANIGVLSVHHPDILEFIRAKEQERTLDNFNISVSVTDDFIQRVIDNRAYDLINPRSGAVAKSLNARDVFDQIVMNAWKSGDPGILYIDAINRKNPTPDIGAIETTNPCGEVPLLAYESCNLGSINLTKMFRGSEFDYDKVRTAVGLAVHFLDNVIDCNSYPLQQIDDMTKHNRKVGLGVMGFADCLVKLNIPYDSPEALDFAHELMACIQDEARRASAKLAEKRGSFANITKSVFKDAGPMRNATVTSIAPTGTISTIANVSSGIEPFFSIGYLRHALDTTLLVINPLFEQVARERGFYSPDLLSHVVRKGSVQDIADIPADVKKIFLTAHDIAPEVHVKMQAAFQKHVDNAVSKTINLREDATLEQTKAVFLLAHTLSCKGVTIYRYGSKNVQALELGNVDPDDICYSGVCSY